MGKTRKIKLVVRMSFINYSARRREVATFEWKTKVHGKPTAENLEKFRAVYNQSLQAGGVNEHLRSGQSDYGKAEIYDQFTHQVVAEFNPPVLEVA